MKQIRFFFLSFFPYLQHSKKISKQIEEFIETSDKMYLIIRKKRYENGYFRQTEEKVQFNASLEQFINRIKQNGQYVPYIMADLLDDTLKEFKDQKNKTIGKLFLKLVKGDLIEEGLDCLNIINKYDKEIKNNTNVDQINQLLESLIQDINRRQPTADISLQVVASSGFNQ